LHYLEASAVITEHTPITIALEEETEAQFHWTASLPEEIHSLDDAMVLFTPGTIGDPKAVRRSHNSAMSHGVLLNHYQGLEACSIMGCMQFNQEAPAQLLAEEVDSS
jgi:acyl-CoA synthetase (AMP-forming)/AMP-acid ligase II